MRTLVVFCAVFALMGSTALAVDGLVHRYSFNDGTANDLVGSMNGTALSGVSFSGGQALFDGGGNSYISLGGNDIASIAAAHNAVTIETWGTYQDNGFWARIYDFGHGVPESDPGGTGGYMFWNVGDNSLAGVSNTVIRPLGGGEHGAFWTSPGLGCNTYVHTVAVYDCADSLLTSYVFAPSGSYTRTGWMDPNDLAGIPSDKGYIGRSMYWDPLLKGSVDEFRIWDKALTLSDVQLYNTLGPDSFISGSLTSAANGPWTTPDTWTGTAPPSGYPDANTSTVINAAANGAGVTLISTAGDTSTLNIGDGGKLNLTGGTLTLHDTTIGALNTTGGTLHLDGASTLNVPLANTSASLAGLTYAAGATVNVTNELKVDADFDLSNVNLATPKLHLVNGKTLTKSNGVDIPSGAQLLGNGTIAGPVSVAGGGLVAPSSDTGSIGMIHVGALTLNSGSLLNFKFGTGNNDSVVVDGDLTLNGGGFNLYVDGSTNAFSTIGTYTLLEYGGMFHGSTANLSVLNKVAGYRYSFRNFEPPLGLVSLNIAQGPLWSGADGANWSDAANWSGVAPGPADSLVYAAAGNGGGVSHNDTSGSSFPSIEFSAGAAAFTLTGSAVTLTGDLNGDVIVNRSADTQNINLPVVLGADAAVNPVSGQVVFGSTGTIDNGGHVLTIRSGRPVTLNGAMTGAGGVTVSSGATLNLGSSSSLSGSLTINGGNLDNTSGAALTLANNPTQNWAGNFTFLGSNNLDLGTGPVTMTADMTLTMNQGTLTVGGAIGGGHTLNANGNGSLVLSGGGALGFLGIYQDQGTVTVSGGNPLAVSGQVDDSTWGTTGPNSRMLVVSNGTLTCDNIRISHDEGARARMLVAGSGSFTANYVQEGFNGAINSLIVQDNGQFRSNGNWDINPAHNGHSYVSVSGNGAISTGGDVRFGSDNGVNWGGPLGSTQYCNVQVSGNASLTIGGQLTMLDYIGDCGAGGGYSQVDQTGGKVTVNSSNGIIMSREFHSGVMQAAYNLAGGTLATQKISAGTGVGLVNFHGGTLAYSGAGPQPDFVSMGSNAASGAYVYEGATIDTGGQTVTLNQPLLSPNSNSGVTAISLPAPIANGYTIPPAVIISGGGGTGATAVATIDASGAVTAVTVTNPGVGYTSKPSVMLNERSNEAITTIDPADVSIAPNAYTGGLTKTGAGTLVIGTSNNTYAGATVIKQGTLQLQDGASRVSPVAKYLAGNVSGGTLVNVGAGGAAMNGAMNNATVDLTGGPGGTSALSFNGSNSSIDVSNGITDLSGGGNWTVAGWVKTTQAGFTLFNKGNGSGWNGGYSTIYLKNAGNGPGSGGILGGVRWGGGWMAGTTSVNDGAWHFVAVTDSGGTKQFYVDGAPDPLAGGDFNNADIGSIVRFGWAPNAGDGPATWSDGEMNNLQFYSVPLTAAQISQLYTGGSVVPGPDAALPATTDLRIAGGATFDLHGVAGQTVASLADEGTAPGGTVTNNGGAMSILTVSGSGSTAFSGQIVDGSAQVRLVKAGAGTLTLSGSNTHSGGTLIGGGVLAVSASQNLGTGGIEIDSAVLRITGSTAASFGQAVTLWSSSTADVTNSAGATLAGNIGQLEGPWQLTKTGSGALTLSGSNNYGDTAVLNGTLDIATAASLPPGGNLTIASGGHVVLASGLSHAISLGGLTITSGAGGGLAAAAAPEQWLGGAAGAPAAPTPEPGTILLLLAGAIAGLLAWRRRRLAR